MGIFKSKKQDGIYTVKIPDGVLEKSESIEIKVTANPKKMEAEYDWAGLSTLDTEGSGLVQVPWLKYYDTVFEKRQAVLHHTVSGPGIGGDLYTWKKKQSHIAACVIIDRDGKINQLFSSKYWGYHLGCGNSSLDMHSIAVELDNWGQLTETSGKLYTVYGNQVDVPITRYNNGFRGEQLFEAYTREQLWSLGELLLLWNEKYGISLGYNGDMWDVSERALNGEPGIWAHVSFRPSGKWDVHPDPQLISLLRHLK